MSTPSKHLRSGRVLGLAAALLAALLLPTGCGHAEHGDHDHEHGEHGHEHGADSDDTHADGDDHDHAGGDGDGDGHDGDEHGHDEADGDGHDDDGGTADARPVPGPRFAGTVTLADEFAELDGQRTLFIVVKARKGPPMPRAVHRVDGARLPYTFDIGSEHVMLQTDNPEVMLQGDLVIYARLDADGTPMSGPDDVESAEAGAVQGTPIDLVINQRS